MPVSTSCNFETKAVCGYTQDKSDNFDWRWSTGSTASAMTGPNNDHTYGTPAGEDTNQQIMADYLTNIFRKCYKSLCHFPYLFNLHWMFYAIKFIMQIDFLPGHYMYIESSDARPNAKARIISPRLPGSGTRCLQFWYSMFGQQVNTLNVYAKSRSLGNVLWTLSGNQGMDWKIAQVTIPRGSSYNVSLLLSFLLPLSHIMNCFRFVKYTVSTSPHTVVYFLLLQIVFEASRGTGVHGDIAIDDILLKQGSCPLPGKPTKH